MAINREKVESLGDAIREVAEEVARLYPRIVWVLEQNSDNSIDWNSAIECVPDDATSGNLDSRPYSRAEVSNAIFSLQQIQFLLTSQAITQGDHLGNINKISRPLRG